MNDHDPTDLLGKAMPDAPPPARFDLDRVVSDGYRARRRHRAALGGAATMGVAVLAAVTALAVNLNTTAPNQGAADGFDFDPAMAGYPENEEWNYGADAQLRAQALTKEAKTAFGDLLVEAGYLEAGALDYEAPAESEIHARMDEQDTSYGEALSELGYNNLPLQFSPRTSPGNYGQVYLRSFIAMDNDEEAETPAFTIEAMLPGGWTAEPGPVGEESFPQHLIDDDAEEFTTEELDDGRTLMVADDGCSYDIAVVYPNESALRSSWDLGCSGEQRDVSLDALTDAMLAMPETDYDTSELAAIEELSEPSGWPAGDGWSEKADGNAAATAEAVEEAITGLHPGAGVIDESVGATGLDQSNGTTLHQYSMTVTLPYEAIAGEGDVNVNLTYTLPGGWTAWTPETAGDEGMHLPECDGKLGIECEQVEVDGRTAVLESSAEAGVYKVTVLDEDGWAVSLFMTFEGEFDLTLEEFTELAAALPAPVYDEGASPSDD